MKMNVELIRPNGFCHGVVTAIKKVLNTIDTTDGDIYVLGMIIHNEIVVKELEKLGVKTIDDKTKTRLELLDQIESGTVIFTAHGVSDEVRNKAKEKGLNIVDASCKDVTKTQVIIKEHLDNSYDVIYIGKHAHPETEACVSIHEKINLVTNLEDVENLNISNQKIIITNQTTLSILDIQPIIDAITAKYPQVVFINEICKATEMRQRAIINSSDADLIIIVGDKRSNNTQKLVDLGNQQAKVETVRISSLSELDLNLLKGRQLIKVSAGASTPSMTTRQVLDFIANFKEEDRTTHIKPQDVDGVLKMYK
jgi:4-hydroxy-3-methylbut-2-enyl diphosphate reductase